MILLYIVSIIILAIIGYLKKENKIYNSKYCFLITKAIIRVVEYFNFTNYYNRNIILYFGKEEVKKKYIYYFSSKIASLLLSMILPVIILQANKEINAFTILFFVVLAIASFKLPDIEINSKLKKRNECILYDFTRFTYDLSLYVNSGLSIYQAFKRSGDVDKNSYFYKHIKLVISNSETGNIFSDELIYFSNKVMLSEINSLISLINQNIKEGGSIKKQLTQFSKEVWEKRKNYIKKKGEQASVKLVFPLTLGLLGVILILITPAIIILKQI